MHRFYLQRTFWYQNPLTNQTRVGIIITFLGSDPSTQLNVTITSQSYKQVSLFQETSTKTLYEIL